MTVCFERVILTCLPIRVAAGALISTGYGEREGGRERERERVNLKHFKKNVYLTQLQIQTH